VALNHYLPVSAANPTTMPFQGKVVNANGTNLADGNYSFTFKLYSVASGGASMWGETQTTVAVASGVFQVNLGSTCSLFTTQTCSTFSNTAIDFNASPTLYLGVTFNGDAAGEMVPRMPLGSVPFAFNADKVGGLGISQLVQLSPGSQQIGSINVNGAIQGGSSVQLGSTTSAGSIILKDGTVNNYQVSLNAIALAGSYVLNLPTTGATAANQCLATTSATQLAFGACSSYTSLAQAYANSGSADILLTNGRNISITAADTATDPNVLVNLQCVTSCGTNGRFAIQNSGSDVLTVAPNGGAVSFQNSTNSSAALQIMTAGGTPKTVLVVNTTNRSVSLDANFVVTSTDPIVSGPAVSPTANTGGSLSGNATTAYYYRVSAIISGTESAASTEIVLPGSTFSPLASPTNTMTFANGAAGGITGAYLYTVTYVSADGETTPSTSANFTANGKKVSISNIPTGSTGTISRKIYRTIAGGADGTQKLLVDLGDNTTTTYTDSTADVSLGAAQPTINNARLNTNTSTVSWSAYGGASSYRIYRGTSSGGENTYLTTASTSLVDTGSAGTAGTPIEPVTGRVGIGVSNPAYKLDVAGNVNTAGAYVSNGMLGVSLTCASGSTFSGLTVTGGIITNTGSCVGLSGGGGSGSTTLQSAYDTSGVTIPQIQLSSSNGGLKVYDAATTVGNLLEVKDSTAANLYFAITASATRFNTLDAASGTVLNLGATASPQATSIALNQDTTLAGGHALNFSNTGNGNVIGLVAPTGAAGYVLSLPAAAPLVSKCLQSDPSTATTLLWGSCGAGGVSTVGAFTGSSIVNGASIGGTTITFGGADATNPGLVSTGVQTFAGAKTFNSTLAVNSGASIPITDQVTIDNTGSTGVTTANANGLKISYLGGAAAVEAAGMRVNFTPGTTSGGTWSGVRIAATASAASGVTAYGVKLETPGGGAGTDTALEVATGWDIGLDLQSGGMQLAALAADPATPTASNLRIYTKLTAGRAMLRAKAPTGVSYNFQTSLADQFITYVTPGNGVTATTFANITAFGAQWANSATAGFTIAAANQTMGAGLNIATTAVSGNNPSLATANLFFRGSAAGSNGFFFFARVGTPDANYGAGATGTRAFVGLTDQTIATMTASDAPIAGNFIGFQYSTNRADTAWKVIRRDGTTTAAATATTALVGAAGQQNHTYDLYLFTPGFGQTGAGTIFWRADDLVGGTTSEGSFTTTLPTNTVAMKAGIGVQTLTTTIRNLVMSKIYLESDR